MSAGLNPQIHWTHDDHPEGVTVDDLLRVYESGATIHYGNSHYRVVRVVSSGDEWIAKLAPATSQHT